jgi:hypothetical protein
MTAGWVNAAICSFASPLYCPCGRNVAKLTVAVGSMTISLLGFALAGPHLTHQALAGLLAGRTSRFARLAERIDRLERLPKQQQAPFRLENAQSHARAV